MRKGLLLLVASVVFIAACSGSGDGADDSASNPCANTTYPTYPWVRITTPNDGDSVSTKILIQGWSCNIAPGRFPDTPSPWIYIVVKPIPSDPHQSWWVQPYPIVNDSGRWETNIFVGLESDPSGVPFFICAVASDEKIEIGRYGKEIPVALSRDCIAVTKK